ncbi:hypothetical protein BW893_18205 [Bacillus wiedmannii]|nr:hypothetical protein BW893_18205 [Bacillus wiedmannii]
MNCWVSPVTQIRWSLLAEKDKTLQSHKIKSDILLVYCDLPDNYLKIRELQITEFRKHIDITTKLYTDTGHLMHWDRPEEIAEDVLNWFI